LARIRREATPAQIEQAEALIDAFKPVPENPEPTKSEPNAPAKPEIETKKPDPKSAKLLFSLDHSEVVGSVTFSPDGKSIVSAGEQLVRVWDSETGKEKQTINKVDSRQIGNVQFSLDGKRILTCGRFGKGVQIWDAKTGKRILEKSGPDCAALSPDGKLIAMGALSKIRVCDSKTGEEVLVIKASGSKECVGFSPDGKWIVAGYGRHIGVWDAETGGKHKFYGSHTDEISDVEFSPDGKRIASSSDDGAKPIKVWDFETGKELFTLEISDPNNVSFSSDGKRIVSSGYSTIKVWDSKTGKIMLTLRPNDQEGRVSSPRMYVAISPDGKRIASSGHGKVGGKIVDIVKVWDISGIKP